MLNVQLYLCLQFNGRMEIMMDNKLNLKKIVYATKACDTVMSQYTIKTLPPAGVFHYHQGVFLSGMEKVYINTNIKKYGEYIKSWIDNIVTSSGEILLYDKTRLDDIQPGILLFSLYKDTGRDKYKKAIQTLVSNIIDWPRTNEGGFWHKYCHPNQMWLDEIYMACPFMARSAVFLGRKELFDIAITQIELIQKHLMDEKTGLLYHAYDHCRQETWSDPETGRSPCVWGRALAWYLIGTLDTLEYMPKEYKIKKHIIDNIRMTIDAIVQYQDTETGLWYQLVNLPNDKNNWIELSSSALFTYAISKAIRMFYISNRYIKHVNKAYEGIIDHIIVSKNNIIIPNICVGTGVGEYEFYINRPRSENDLHGMGAFILMDVEYALLKEQLY